MVHTIKLDKRFFRDLRTYGTH